MECLVPPPPPPAQQYLYGEDAERSTHSRLMFPSQNSYLSGNSQAQTPEVVNMMSIPFHTTSVYDSQWSDDYVGNQVYSIALDPSHEANERREAAQVGSLCCKSHSHYLVSDANRETIRSKGPRSN